MKTRFLIFGVCSWMVTGLILSLGAEDADEVSTTTTTTKTNKVTPEFATAISPSLIEKLKAAAANISPPVMQIVQMSDAGADASVIQAFVENSPTAFHLKAEEIIYLHEHGISKAIVTAMLQHQPKEAVAEAGPPMPPPTAPSDNAVINTAPAATGPIYVNSPTYYVYDSPAYPYATLPAVGAYYAWPYSYGHSYYGHGSYGHSHNASTYSSLYPYPHGDFRYGYPIRESLYHPQPYNGQGALGTLRFNNSSTIRGGSSSGTFRAGGSSGGYHR